MSDFNRINGAELDRHITGNYGEDQFRGDQDELLQAEAVQEVADAIREGWRFSDDFTVEVVTRGGAAGIEVDLPTTGQTIHITVDIRPST